MLTGYNTDIRHGEVVLHVQTEDKGLENPAIESVIYLKGQVLAAKRTAYARLLEEGKGEREIASLMEQQHRTVLAAIRAGRFDARIGEALSGPRARGEGEAEAAAAPAGAPPPLAATPAAPLPAPTDDQGPSLDQVILQYLETEAEQDHLVLVLDGPEEIRPGRLSRMTLRAFSSKSGHPQPAVQVSVRMLSTVSDPRTLLSGETDAKGALDLELDVPVVQGGSAALIITGSSDLGRAEIKQLL
jgi:hypothetical protein